MRKSHKIRDFVSTLLLLGLMAAGSVWLAKQNEVNLRGQYKIIDGDSLVINGREIRMLGIDAPEYRQMCSLRNGDPYSCGKSSRSHLAKLAASGVLNCKGWEEDKYQRLLAICNVGKLDLNAKMVSDGWAVSYGDYQSQEAEARASEIGVWQGGFQSPSSWRKDSRELNSPNWLSKLSLW